MRLTSPLRLIAITLALFFTGCATSPAGQKARSQTRHEPPLPPPPPREFRAAWVATVANIDWPSKPGLPAAQQIAEIQTLLDRAADLNLNAIILQVRPSCDALYESPLEPWSEYLTGAQGVPPYPFYDPLATWIQEAHKRGMELHAWFNPYRARHKDAKSPDAPKHVAVTRPDLVRKFNGWEWLDPGEPEAAQRTLDVILDVVRRYDIDGVHLDDYFYPYKEYLNNQDFPDDASWQKYQKSGGQLARADWRRDNVNRLIRDLYAGIKRIKPHVKFGVSPFGVAHPGVPDTVESKFDQYNILYADPQLWLKEGWLDYCTPQLYWQLDSKQPYADLLKWWAEQNTLNRHLWPG
ncbi:MAG TPA: family 10 glycosylhydrolase, partial [Tepidisphaeraceae bacterium]